MSCAISNGISYPNTTQFINKVFSINQVNNPNCGLASAETQSVLGFCRGSASVPRGFVSFEIGPNGTVSECRNGSDVVDSGKKSPKINEQCDSLPYM